MDKQPGISWYKTKLDREKLRELTRRSNLRGLMQILPHILMVAATGYFVFYSFRNLSWPITVAALFLHGTIFNFLGMFTGIHELSHKTAFRSKKLNEFFYYILGIVTWNNVHKFRVSHRTHHQVTVFTGRDLEVVLPERFRPIDWFYMFTINPISGAGGVPGVLSMIWETVRYAFGSFNKEWENILFPESAVKARRKIFNFSRATLIFHIVTASWFIISGNWILVLIINIGAYIAPWLAILSALPQHIGLCGDVPDWRMNCRTMKLNPVVQFFYWNMNYHIEHHMYASVPFHRMKALHEEIKHDCPEPSRGLIRTWRDLLPVIRKQRIDPGFCIKPELPI